MSNNGPFGMDPDEFERAIAEAGEGIRDAVEMVNNYLGRASAAGGWAGLLGEVLANTSRPAAAKPKPEPEEAGGVWVIYTLDDDGAARVEQAYPTELDALRAHKNNVDPTRKVRFLPYGVTVSLLDAAD